MQTLFWMIFVSFAMSRAFGQTPPWHYTLLEGSSLVNDCLICGRPTFFYPLRGTFDLRALNTNGINPVYELSNFSLHTTTGNGETYRIVQDTNHTSTLLFSGKANDEQTITLWVQIQRTSTNQFKSFTNEIRVLTRRWPMLEFELNQTDANLIEFFRLHFAAAPLREIWFSTASSFTSGTRPAKASSISNGDVLSNLGRVVESNGSLLANLGAFPGFGTFGIDSLDLLPGGEIAFSLNQDIFSETKGITFHHGDVISKSGQILRRNQDLLRGFGFPTNAPDAGLDAVQVLSTNEILFSIQQDLVAPSNQLALGHGDILSTKGIVYRKNSELLARFHPAESKDYGLDALYLWPSGEIWFSTELGFNDQSLGPIQSGDILSDAGYRVFQNLELISPFAPLEDTADFGLDGLFVITDTTAPAPAPRLFSPTTITSPLALSLGWQGAGRVFQVLSATNLPGPFIPSSEIIPGQSWIDLSFTPTNRSRFYQLRQW